MLYLFPILAILIAAIQIIFFDKPIIETLLANILFFWIGFGGIFAFVGHTFKSDEVAEKIGWEKGNPFQHEVGFANLGFGIAGIMSMWFRGEFWLAIIVSVSIFYIGAGITHIIDIKKNSNKAEFNAGAPLYFDFIEPIILILLYILYSNNI